MGVYPDNFVFVNVLYYWTWTSIDTILLTYTSTILRANTLNSDKFARHCIKIHRLPTDLKYSCIPNPSSKHFLQPLIIILTMHTFFVVIYKPFGGTWDSGIDNKTVLIFKLVFHILPDSQTRILFCLYICDEWAVARLTIYILSYIIFWIYIDSFWSACRW